nr:unnamed protein product [Callosobruchus analis]
MVRINVSSFRFDNFRATLANNDQIKSPVSPNKASLHDEYNPYDNRSLEHPNTFLGALIHIVKASLGLGILSIPRAFKTAGLLVGFIGTVIIGLICTHTVHILVRASQKVCVKIKTPSLDFAETAEETFKTGPAFLRGWSSFARNFVDVSVAATHLLGLAVYVVFIAETLIKLLSPYYEPIAESSAEWALYIKLMILLPLILCCQIKELKHLVPFSFIANVTMITAFSITLYYMILEMKYADISERHLATNISAIPSFFSTVIFAMEGIGTVMPLENSMVDGKFIGCPGVLNFGMTIVTSLFVGMGFCGYYSFGEATEVTITQNLPSDEIPAQVVQGCISASVFFSFMLLFYVPVDICWRKIHHRISKEKHNLAHIIMRTGFVVGIVTVAAAAGKHLDTLIQLVGAVCLSTLGIFIPAVIDIVINWKNWGVWNWSLYKNFILIFCSLFGLVCGSYFALEQFF